MVLGTLRIVALYGGMFALGSAAYFHQKIQGLLLRNFVPALAASIVNLKLRQFTVTNLIKQNFF